MLTYFRTLGAAVLLLAACEPVTSPLSEGRNSSMPTSITNAPPPPADTNYILVDLGPQDVCPCFRTGFFSQALWLNDHGAIASSRATPYVWDSASGFTFLPDLGGGPITIVGFNEAGQVAGTAKLPSGLRHAVFWSQGTLTDLGTLGGDESVATGMDQNGRVVGWSRTRKGVVHAFSWSGRRMKDLNPHKSGSSVATAVDNYSDRVGLQLQDSTSHAAILDHGTLIDLGYPPGVPAGQPNFSPSSNIVGFAEGLAVGRTSYTDFRNEGEARLWTWDGSAIRVLPMVVDDPRYAAVARWITRKGAVAIEEYPLDLLSPFWETAIWSGSTLRVAYPGSYPEGIENQGFHAWQMDENEALVGGVKQSFPIVNGSYAVVVRGGAISYLPGLGGTSSNALAINTSGVIAGWAQDSGTNVTHLVLWKPRSVPVALTGR